MRKKPRRRRDPTPAEIARRSAAIQARWSEAERLERARALIDRRLAVPTPEPPIQCYTVRHGPDGSPVFELVALPPVGSS